MADDVQIKISLNTGKEISFVAQRNIGSELIAHVMDTSLTFSTIGSSDTGMMILVRHASIDAIWIDAYSPDRTHK